MSTALNPIRLQGDSLYESLLKEYVKALASDGECIEFFIEGTRSRSGVIVRSWVRGWWRIASTE